MTTTYANEELSTIPGSYVCEECDRWVRGPHHPSMGSLTHGHYCSRHPRNLDGFKEPCVDMVEAERARCVSAVLTTYFEASDQAPISELRRRIVANILKAE